MARKDCVRCSCIEEKQKKLVDALMSAQQCVRFVELDRSGRTRTDGELQAFARADVGDEWVYEVQCEVAEDEGMTGWLYMQAMIIPKHGLSFVGFYSPVEKGRRVWGGGKFDVVAAGTRRGLRLNYVAVQDGESALVEASGWPGRMLWYEQACTK